jgi:deoxyhypusine monooxygenase
MLVFADPAPAMSTSSVDTNRVSHLRSILVDSHESLWQRYRAMFALRNIGSVDAVVAIADGWI